MRLSMKLPLLALAIIAGCASDPNKKTNSQVQKEAAQKQWADARAGVMKSLAKDQYQNGQFDKCRSTLDEALKLSPQDVALHLMLARLGIEQGNLELADRETAAARKIDPKNAEADYLSGIVWQRWQKLQTAYDFYRAAAEKQPTEQAYLMAQAEMLVALGRDQEALDLLQSKVVYFEHSPAIRDAAGLLLMQKEKYAQAVELFQQASILAGDDLAIREHLGLAQFRDRQWREAADTLGRLVKNETYARRAELYLALGECQLQQGHPRDAREVFEVATQVDPNLAAAWLGLGRSTLECGDPRRAEIALRRSLSLDASSSQAHLLLGYVRLKQDRSDDALTSFSKASALDPSDTVSLCMVGYVLEKLGRGNEAIKCYARALKLRPGDEMANKLMAQVNVNP